MVNDQTDLIRWPEVHKMTGVSIASAYRWMGLGRFPRPIKMGEDGPRSLSLWLRNEIEEFVARRITERGEAYQAAPLETHGRINRNRRNNDAEETAA